MSTCACKHRALGPVHVSIHLYTRYPDTHTLKHTNFFEYYTRKTFSRRLFLEELGKSMVTPLIQRRQDIPRALPSATLVRHIQTPEPGTSAGTGKGEKQKRGSLCAPKDVKTGTVCFKCRMHICKAHTLYCCQSCA